MAPVDKGWEVLFPPLFKFNFYVDPKTGKPVYTNAYLATGIPYYGSVAPFYSSTPFYSPNYWPGGYVLPPVFNSNNPWG